MPQFWFEVLSIVALAIALLCAATIALDILAGHRQMMPVMDYVWPITALYFGPIALASYWALGRPMSKPEMERRAEQMKQQHGRGGDGQSAKGPMQLAHEQLSARRLFWEAVWVGVTHCGAGCTLGDLIAEWAIFIIGVRIAGQHYWPEILLDYALAYILGIVFQYYSIAPMRGISGFKGIWAAIKADTLSLTAFEVGLFAWMAFMMFGIFPHLEVDSPAYWFMMQIGMCIGFATSFPMNWWLIKKGIKEQM